MRTRPYIYLRLESKTKVKIAFINAVKKCTDRDLRALLNDNVPLESMDKPAEMFVPSEPVRQQART